jgi:hypothetical protein
MSCFLLFLVAVVIIIIVAHTHFLFQRFWGHEPFNEKVYLFFSIGLKYGQLSIKVNADAQKLCTILFPWHMGKYKYKRLPIGIKIAWILMWFEISCLSLSNIWNMLRQVSFLDDNK